MKPRFADQRAGSVPRYSTCERRKRARLSQILDLFREDSELNVYAGELEVRPPDAPTTESDLGELRSNAQLLVNTSRQGRSNPQGLPPGSIMLAESLPLACRPPSLAPHCPASRP